MAKKKDAVAASASGILDVTVVLLDAGYASTAIAPIEIFHSAGVLWNWLQGEEAAPRFRVNVASVDGAPVRTIAPISLVPSCAISDVKHTDLIVISASNWEMQQQIMSGSGLLAWLKEWHSRGAYIAAICSGAAFLAEAGLLDGRRATTHWGVADSLRARYPKVNWQPDHFVIEDGKILCSGGVYAAVDLSLYLVEKFCGHEIALQCAKALVVGMPRSRQSGYAVLPLSRPHADEKIRSAEEYLQANFERDVPIAAIAAHVGMGDRNFIRRFKAATGRLPGAYMQSLRVAAAKDLLEGGTLSIQDVCWKTGYEDLAFFRGLFKRHTGMTPGEYRKRFGRAKLAHAELASG